MKDLRFILFLFVIGMVFWNFFLKETKPSPPKAQEQVTQKPKPSIFRSYFERGIDNSWPKANEDSNSVAKEISTKNYYVVFDGSGSMAEVGCSNGERKIQVAKRALTEFFSKLPNNANFGLFAFDSYGQSERLALANHPDQDYVSAIEKLVAGGGTPLSTGIDAGLKALSQQGLNQLGYGEYHLVVVTDGKASRNFNPDKIVTRLLHNTPIVLHTIGFCIKENHSLNIPGYTLYKAADNPQLLMEGLGSVLAESPDFQVTKFE